jgi:RNA polymerase sigma-70 factor (ECF subfamily)
MERVDDDAELMLRYAHGDVGAFERLYARHKGPLYRYLLRQVRDPAVASDLFQEVWFRIVAMRHRYEIRAKFATFLFQIAHHCTIDHYRRRRSLPGEESLDQRASIEIEPESPEHEQPDRIAERGEQQSALLAAIAALPSEQREAFLLREEAGLDVEEIARVTGVGIETAKSRVRYAIRKLRLTLAERATAPVAAIEAPAPAHARARAT